MSKKSYKRHQNRLYREIKKRIIAEQKVFKPCEGCVKYDRPIITLKCHKVILNKYKDSIEFVKDAIVTEIMEKLLSEGYLMFDIRDSVDEFIQINAYLDIVKPLDRSHILS